MHTKTVLRKKDGVYTVRTTSVPESGKANAQLVTLLAKHFGVGKSHVDIIQGHASRYKVVDITK